MLCYSLNKQKICKGIPIVDKFPVVSKNTSAKLHIADIQIYKMAEASNSDPWLYSLYELLPRTRITIKDKILLYVTAKDAVPDPDMGDKSILLDVCPSTGAALLLCSKGTTCLKLTTTSSLLVFNGAQPAILPLEDSLMNPDLVGLSGVQALSISDILSSGASVTTSSHMDLNNISMANT